MIQLAERFFDIANIITSFSVLQALALMYSFKDPKVTAALIRWRPFTSLLAKHAGTGYIIAVVSCGVAEYVLRKAAGQGRALLVACVIAVVLRCVAIQVTSSVFCQMFVAICREQNWLNKFHEGREFQTPRILAELSGSEKRLQRLAVRVDKKLFRTPKIVVVHAEDFDEILTPDHPKAQIEG